MPRRLAKRLSKFSDALCARPRLVSLLTPSGSTPSIRPVPRRSALTRMLLAATLALSCLTPRLVAAQGQGDMPKPNDYGASASWLCRPDLPADKSACAIDHTTTVVAANGTLARETWTADPNAPIDCFYVYPTISTDQTDNSDMKADPAEINVVRQQAARFGSVCRVFAPLYRQVTLTGLRKMLAPGATVSLDRGAGYDDVRDAWKYYLDHDNKGRGFVLISHSQGSFVMMRLVREEIEGKPVQTQMVSGLILGAPMAVAKGKDTGGAFKTIPLCHATTQIGCVINYSAFRSNIAPPQNTLFGRVPDPAMEAACVNPAALGGGSGELRAYLDTA